jgi:hypothetical protein
VDRRGRTGKVINLINFKKNGLYQIMTQKLKIGFAKKMGNIPFFPCKKIIKAYDVVALGDQTITEMRAKKSRTTGDQYSFLIRRVHQNFLFVMLFHQVKNASRMIYLLEIH